MQTEEPENEKMKILLSFYPDIKINQLSDHTATMFLSNDYDLFIDTNDNPGKWSAQRKRGALRTDLMLRGGRVPKDDVDKADKLITRYQDALVSWVMEMEEREKGGIKKDVEVLKWPKRLRGQAPADPEEVQPQPEEKALAAQRLEENLEEYLVLTKGPEKPINPALPEEPNLEEIQEAPADQEEVKPEIRSIKPLLPGPIIPPSVVEKIKSNAIDIRNQVMAAVEKANEKNLKAAFPDWDEKDQELEKKIEEIKAENQEETAQDIKRRIVDQYANNVIKLIDQAKLDLGEDYEKKIEAKSKEIFDSLLREIGIAQANEPESQDTYLADRLSKIYESLEVLQLLQDCQARQNLRAVQEKEPENQKRDTLISDVLNEVYINKNGKGYSWRITARAADMETAIQAALEADKRLQDLQKKGAGDNES